MLKGEMLFIFVVAEFLLSLVSVAGDMGATQVNSVNPFSHPVLITVDKICLIVLFLAC